MHEPPSLALLSPVRERLASFDHAYTLALRLRGETGVPHYVVRGVLPIQPYRVTMRPPDWPDRWLAMVA